MKDAFVTAQRDVANLFPGECKKDVVTMGPLEKAWHDAEATEMRLRRNLAAAQQTWDCYDQESYDDYQENAAKHWVGISAAKKRTAAAKQAYLNSTEMEARLDSDIDRIAAQ